MKRLWLILACAALCTSVARADDQVRQVQTELKNQGFYFGNVDGEASAAYAAAIKRFQIRSGLQPTGEVSAEVLQALGLGADGTPAPVEPSAPAEPPAPPSPPPGAEEQPARPPVNLRRDDTAEDRRFLNRNGEQGVRDPSVVRPPAPLGPPQDLPPGPGGAAPNPIYNQLFQGTPYRSAPEVVQKDTARRAQHILAQRRYYREDIDGLPGPAMEEAILSYQRAVRLPITGRLDLETLNALRLLPGRGPGNPPLKPFNAPGRGAAPHSDISRKQWVE